MTLRQSILLPILFVAHTAATDLTGAWTFEWNPDFGGQHPTSHECHIKQQGDALAIQCDEQAMKGTVHGKTVTFEHTTGLKNEVKATYKATLDQNGTTMTGSWYLFAKGTNNGKFAARKH